ncbi:Growth factor receptor-bound protein 14 [Chelonia mydas]|uniref:Growth factor receptor-bound protein 14 n=1 Tax=Chelonia mydas TaxID=8469 RepID=M7CD74_CHEMY|nr:Growth factor receptor-bound protein 14 [Chelonia mydas]
MYGHFSFPILYSLFLQVIKVYSEDDTSRALEVPGDVTARDVCQLLILKNHYIDDHSWTLFEHLPRIGLERMIEDHELVIEVQSNWGIEEENRLYFRKNYAKYEFFKHPMNYFPEHMVSLSSETSGMIGHTQILQPRALAAAKGPRLCQWGSWLQHTDVGSGSVAARLGSAAPGLLRNSLWRYLCQGGALRGIHHHWMFGVAGGKYICNILFQMFLSSSTYPEIHGYLHAKEQGKKSSWKKLYFLLRRSGLYFSTKGTSKEPRHLQFFSEFSSSDMYMSLAGKKTSGTPANYGFCFKPNKAGGVRDLKQLCADDEQSRTCWMTAIRLLKRSISENSLVAMDFSGHRSRVIENPTEALSVAVEEGLAWRLEDDGKLFYTLDDGHTRFTDLIQLVEFYQLNKGVLPCKLKHYCAQIAL